LGVGEAIVSLALRLVPPFADFGAFTLDVNVRHKRAAIAAGLFRPLGADRELGEGR
jgi:hypothetical protein